MYNNSTRKEKDKNTENNINILRNGILGWQILKRQSHDMKRLEEIET